MKEKKEKSVIEPAKEKTTEEELAEQDKEIAEILLEKKDPNIITSIVLKDFNIEIDCIKQEIIGISTLEFLQFLKLKYKSFQKLAETEMWEKIKTIPEAFSIEKLTAYIETNFEATKPFTYEQAFNLKSKDFQSLVFGSIDVPDMIKNLGHKRLKVEGKTVTHKQFAPSGEYLGDKTYEVIYETHSVDGDKLGIREPLYAIKCWCTSTDEEHWLFIDEKYKDSPLEAIASTFVIHETIIPHIKCLKRQGDLLFVELKEPFTPKEDDKLVALTSEQYFSWLDAQS